MKVKEILLSLFSLLGCVSLTGCKQETVLLDYEEVEESVGNETVSDGVYARLGTSDGKIALPTAGRYTYFVDYATSVVDVEKIEYDGWALKEDGQIWLNVRVYCTAVQLQGDAAYLLLKCYDGDGYLTYTGVLYKKQLLVGDKFVMECATDFSLRYEQYARGDIRLEIVNMQLSE